MRESVIYQDILKEGEQRGIAKGIEQGIETGRKLERYALLRKIIPILQAVGFPVERILNVVGVTLEELDVASSDETDVTNQ